MAQSNHGRTTVIVVLAINVVFTVLLAIASVFIFHQVYRLKEENNILRNKWTMYMSLQKQSENLDINPTEEVRLPSIKVKPLCLITRNIDDRVFI